MSEQKEYKYHPLCLKFPIMSKEELQDLANDIEENGQRLSAIEVQGMIIDGRNRIEACKLIDKEPLIKDRSDVLKNEADIAKFIFSANLNRRHLSASVRAALGVEFMEVLQTGEKPLPKMEARKEAAKEASVSERYVSAAESLKEESPKQFEQVLSGEKNIPAAQADAKKEKLNKSGSKPGKSGKSGGRVIPNEAGEGADEEAALRKAEKIVSKCQEKLAEIGYRIVDDTIERI